MSDPRFERDYLRLLTVKSPALKGRGDITVFLPPGSETLKDAPLVLLLHGVYGSHWSWTLKGGVHLTALEMIRRRRIRPMVLVMPSDGLWGDGSGYVKHEFADYEKWVVEDAIGSVTEINSCLSTNSPLFVAGLSMGGYGALRLGAKYAPLFKGISGHSSITDPNQLARFVQEPLETYGAPLQSEDANVFYWLNRNRENLPPLRFDCGTSDELIEDNRRLHRALETEDIPHQYHEFAGGHSWDYWGAHVADSLLFFESCCG